MLFKILKKQCSYHYLKGGNMSDFDIVYRVKRKRPPCLSYPSKGFNFFVWPVKIVRIRNDCSKNFKKTIKHISRRLQNEME